MKMLLIGGKRIFPETIHYAEVFMACYDPQQLTLTWKPLPLIGDDAEPRSYHSAVCHRDGVVYIFGGIVQNVYSNELCTLCPAQRLWRNISCAEVPGYAPPVPRSGHVAFIDETGEKMIVAGSYAEDSEDLTVAVLHFASMRWSVARVDPRGQTPSRRAAISGALLPQMIGGARLPMMVVFGGFELTARRCFNDLFVLPL